MQRMNLRKAPPKTFIDSSEPDALDESDQDSDMVVLEDSDDNGSSGNEPLPVPIFHDTEPKQIIVPEWQQELPKLENKPPQSDRADFDLIGRHHRLEIIESRIEKGRYEYYKLPLQVIELDTYMESPFELSSNEEKMLDEYVNIVSQPKIPNFWPKRPWDRPDDLLPGAISEQLARQIEKKIAEQLFRDDATGRQRHAKKSRSELIKIRKKVRRAAIIVKLPTLEYWTDDYDDQTDFDW
jgi:hypothetical protein